MRLVRRIVIVALGLVLIIDSLSQSHFLALQFIVGLVMVGAVPADALIDYLIAPRHDEGELDRLGEVMRRREEDGT